MRFSSSGKFTRLDTGSNITFLLYLRPAALMGETVILIKMPRNRPCSIRQDPLVGSIKTAAFSASIF